MALTLTQKDLERFLDDETLTLFPKTEAASIASRPLGLPSAAMMTEPMMAETSRKPFRASEWDTKASFTTAVSKPSFSKMNTFYMSEEIDAFVRKRIEGLNAGGLAPVVSLRGQSVLSLGGDKVECKLHNGNTIEVRRDHSYYISHAIYDLATLTTKFLLRGITTTGAFTAERIEIEGAVDLYKFFRNVDDFCGNDLGALIKVADIENRKVYNADALSAKNWVEQPQDWAAFVNSYKIEQEREQRAIEKLKPKPAPKPVMSENWGVW